ncbi:MAG TPA: rhomboid family intramembrane serine protease [Bacteroidetes bacterium]|nr:rhomboid family intramembrane serine protease [Bacteroidota bacterium]HIL56700.1 rhomboid family intramembrane serine protease [Rhodothermales bacterium]
MADPNSPVTRFQIWRAALPPAIRILLTINVATYVVYVVFSIFGLGDWLLWLALPLDPSRLLVQPWSVLTHGFTNLYAGFFGLISFAFAMAWLNWVGRELEETYGSHQLFGLYLLATLCASLTGMLGLSAWGNQLLPVYGAWSAVGAVIVYAAVMTPERGIGLWLVGVISMKWIAIAFIVLDLAFSPVSLKMAHIGAYLVGLGFGVLQKRGVELGAWARPLFSRGGRSRAPRPSYSAPSSGWAGRATSVATRTRAERTPRRKASAPRRADGPPTQADIDRILDKINEKGLGSLSADEKKVLEKWSGGG